MKYIGYSYKLLNLLHYTSLHLELVGSLDKLSLLFFKIFLSFFALLIPLYLPE